MAKRGRPVGSGGKCRQKRIRMTDEEFEMLEFVAKFKGKNMTDILLDGLKIQYEECENERELYEDSDFEEDEDDFYYDDYPYEDDFDDYDD